MLVLTPICSLESCKEDVRTGGTLIHKQSYWTMLTRFSWIY